MVVVKEAAMGAVKEVAAVGRVGGCEATAAAAVMAPEMVALMLVSAAVAMMAGSANTASMAMTLATPLLVAGMVGRRLGACSVTSVVVVTSSCQTPPTDNGHPQPMLSVGLFTQQAVRAMCAAQAYRLYR